MALKQNPGFMAALGMDVDPQAIAQEQRQKAMTNSLQLVDKIGYQFAAERAAAQTGAMLGAAISSRNARLTDEQKNMVNAQKSVEARMRNWREANGSATPKDQQLEYMRIVSEEAYKHGLTDIAAQAGGAYQDAMMARQEQELELRKLKNEAVASDLEPDIAKERLEGARASRQAALGVGRLTPIYKYGETNPNNGQMAYIDPTTFEAVTVGPQGEVRIPSGEYTTDRPTRPDAYGRGGRAAGEVGATNTELGTIRNMGSGLYRRGRVMTDLGNLLTKSISKDGSTIVMGKGGQFVSTVNRWATDLYNIIGVGGGAFTAVGKDGKEYSIDTDAGRNRLANEYKDVIDSFLPANVKDVAGRADEYRSLVVQLMYLEARAQESGAKQFSDADIERNAQIIGANVTDPQTLRNILLSSYDRAYGEFRHRINQFDPIYHNQIYSKAAMEEIEQQRAAAYEAFGTIPESYSLDEAAAAQTPAQSEDQYEWKTMPNGARVRVKKPAEK